MRRDSCHRSPIVSCCCGREAAAQEQLPDARVCQDLVRPIRDAGAPELQHDAVVRVLQRALGVLHGHGLNELARFVHTEIAEIGADVALHGGAGFLQLYLGLLHFQQVQLILSAVGNLAPRERGVHAVGPEMRFGAVVAFEQAVSVDVAPVFADEVDLMSQAVLAGGE